MSSCVIVILGVTGDLAKRKLLPSLYHLVAEKKIDNIHIVGAALEDVTAEVILERIRPFISRINSDAWQQFCTYFSYQKVDFAHQSDFALLFQKIESIELQNNFSGNRLIYLATAAYFFCSITRYLSLAGIIQKIENQNDKKWYRVVFEKPFGNDMQSAHKINECIAHYLHEHQIYRIDHYLTKELVSNIALIRFTNCVFEPLWNNRYIDNVQIIVSEDLCIDTRGGYYDKYGALKDVVQNHIMSLLALVGMESPEKLNSESVAAERAKVLEKVVCVDGILGQYSGYDQERDVEFHSKTETFAMLYLQINNPRWAGVPFYVKTGKCLNKKETVIHLKFKQVDCLLTKNCPSESNYLTIQIAPEATFALSLNAKKVGEQAVMPIKMEYCHSCLFADQTPQAYEILLHEVLKGERSVTVRFDEIEHAWRLIDSIKEMHLPLYTYEQGTGGPIQIKDFERKHGMRWRS